MKKRCEEAVVKQRTIKIFFVTFIILLSGVMVQADDRTEPVDILVALDKSLSMEEEIDAVKNYVNTQIVDNLLQNGDFFLIVAFYGKTNIIVSDFIQGKENKEEIKSIVSSIQADGRFTDIGNALDKLKEQVEKYSSDTRRKTLLLITDGKHEPPPESAYYSKDGSYSHEYLKVTSETQKAGWKIIVIGLGQESAKELAEALSAEYAEASEGPSAEELKKLIPDLTGTLKVVGETDFSPVKHRNNATLTLRLETSLFSDPPILGVKSIRLDADGYSQANILPELFETRLPAEGETEIKLNLKLDGTLPPGSYEGKITFNFSSKDHFEEELTTSFRVNSFLQNYPWVLPVGILLLILLILLIIFLLRKIVRGRKVVFRMLVEEKPLRKGRDTFVARLGKDIFIKESMDVLDIAEKKTSNSIAKLTLTDSGLRMTFIESGRFPGLKTAPRNVLESSCIIRTESGKDYHVKFTGV
jgi:Mg-chelatase subunit ChlD